MAVESSRRRGRTVVVVLGAIVIGCLPQACGSDNALTALDGSCFLTSDCEPGLVCAPTKKNGPKVCTNNLDAVAGQAPPDGGPGDAAPAAEGGEAGPTPDGSTPPPPPPPEDSGSQPDTGGSTEPDTGAPDTGTD